MGQIEEASTIIKGIDARLTDIDAKSAALVLNTTLSVDELTDQCASLDKVTRLLGINAISQSASSLRTLVTARSRAQKLQRSRCLYQQI